MEMKKNLKAKHVLSLRGQCRGPYCVIPTAEAFQYRFSAFWLRSKCSISQVPKKHFNLDDDGMTWDLWISYLLTQGSWDWGVWQISTSRILHSGQNLRWTGFLNLTFTLKSLYMVTTNINKHNGISFLVQIFHKESDMYKIRCEIRCEIVI